jgi:phosphatidylserine/phosphatidylglycerophosphate/cardiolipin synthase-like enzyme
MFYECWQKTVNGEIRLRGSALGMTTSLISAAFAASIVTCFAPEQDCAALAIGAIDAARQEILVSAYVLTNGSGFLAALVRAHGRGVDVRLIADRLTPCTRQEGVSALAAAGILVWIDDRARVAHEKALTIDRRVTVMGATIFQPARPKTAKI